MAIRKTNTTKEKEVILVAPIEAAPVEVPTPAVEVHVAAPLAEIPAGHVHADLEVPAPGEKSKRVRVTAVGADQFEPFQRVSLPQGVEVEVELTSWVSAQVQAKVLRLV